MRLHEAMRTAVLVGLTAVAAGCSDEDPIGPPESPAYDLLVLNSTGQTLSPFRVSGDTLRPAGTPIDLGAGFDGDVVAISETRAVSTVSSFGGSRIVVADLAGGGVSRVGFPGPDPELVNPSRASLDAGDTTWVGGRGSDAVYRLPPGASEALLFAGGVGTFVERVVPAAAELYAIDANLDDDGLTWEPLGPGRVVVLRRSDGAVLDEIVLPVTAPNPGDAVLSAGRLVILAGGTFDPVTFAPNLDGALVTVDPATRAVLSTEPLGANGTSISVGRDGKVYVTTTVDYVSLDVLRFDPVAVAFERGPATPIRPVDGVGAGIGCWTVTALEDGRLLCATFRTDAAGRLLLLREDGAALSEVASGFGSTDVAIRP